jgi:uncharacterized protein (TIGR02270 family)
LYAEHLEEASFLYEQRRALLVNPELAWTQIGDFEGRIEAHIDALVVGGDIALDVCRERVAEGDPGELFAAVCVFCRHALAPLLAELLQGLDYEDSDRVRALVDALKYELPESWHDPCRRAIGQSEDRRKMLLAEVIGYRRMHGVHLATLLSGSHPDAQRALLWAIGRTRETGAGDAIRPFYRAAETSVLSTALRTGLRIHDPEALRHLRANANGGQSLPIELALAGGRPEVSPLLARLRDADPDAGVVAALGLLGDLSAVRPLINALTVETLAPTAAEALHLITGAPLFEGVFVAEEPNEDELFDKEVRALREQGQVPRRLNGEPFGETVLRLSVAPSAWQTWLRQHAAQFSADRRYRSGRLYSPKVLLDCLTSSTFPKAYRSLLADELVVRYGIDLQFEADLSVASQRSVLLAAEATVSDSEAAFDKGRWYTFGRA